MSPQRQARNAQDEQSGIEKELDALLKPQPEAGQGQVPRSPVVQKWKNGKILERLISELETTAEGEARDRRWGKAASADYKAAASDYVEHLKTIGVLADKKKEAVLEDFAKDYVALRQGYHAQMRDIGAEFGKTMKGEGYWLGHVLGGGLLGGIFAFSIGGSFTDSLPIGLYTLGVYETIVLGWPVFRYVGKSARTAMQAGSDTRQLKNRTKDLMKRCDEESSALQAKVGGQYIAGSR